MHVAGFSKRKAQTRTVHDFSIESDEQLQNPVLKRFDAVWRAGADTGRLPSRSEIDPGIIADVLPHLMLVDVVRDDEDFVQFRSRIVGEHLVGIDGRLGAGETVHGNPDETDEMIEVVATGRPHYARCRAENVADGVVDYERVTYPLSSNGVDVDTVASILVPRNTAPGRSRLHTFFSWF
jgi:hypothetical protein